jgi:hypothetical protein
MSEENVEIVSEWVHAFNHPMSLAMRPVLEGAGIYEPVRSEAISVLREGNENPEAFRVSSPYRIVRLRHRPAP